MPFFELVLNGVCQNQNIVNVFWYRAPSPLDNIGLFLGAAEALSAEFLETVWTSTSPTGIHMQDRMPNDYTLENIAVNAYDDANVLISSAPYLRAVNQSGLSTQAHTGPQSCITVRMNLEPVFGPGIGLPKKGYVAIGPIIAQHIGEDGRLTATGLDEWQTICSRMGNNLVTELPVETFYPIRVRVTRVAHVITAITWKDVSSVTVMPIVTQRKSRRPEN